MAEPNTVADTRTERKKFEKLTPEKSVEKSSHQTSDDRVVTPPTTVIVRATRKKWGKLSDRNNQENSVSFPSFSDSDQLDDYYEDLLTSDVISDSFRRNS